MVGLRIRIGSCDLLDGTPILDIKPYLSAVDAFPESRSGWLAAVEAQLAAAPDYSLIFNQPALGQLAWLRERWGIDFMTRAAEVLKRTPQPHRSRRIYGYGANRFRMGCGPWRVIFSFAQNCVVVERIAHGYPHRLLASAAAQQLADGPAQIEFAGLWPEPDRPEAAALTRARS